MHVLGIGDNVADHYLHTNVIYPGGNAFNFAAFARLLGAKADYLGVFGDDFAGQHVYTVAQEIGLGLTHCRILHGENGRPKVNIVEGDRIFVGSNRGGVSRERPPVLDESDLKYLSSFDLLHSSINSFMETELSKMAGRGIPISYDFSNHGTDMYCRAHCRYITYSIFSCGHMENEDDIRSLIRRVHSYGCPYVIATRGSRGALFSDNGRIYHHEPKMVKPKDTMGAGDAFLTAFLLSWIAWLKESGQDAYSPASTIRNEAIERALTVGAEFAAKTCMTDGAFGHGVAYPD